MSKRKDIAGFTIVELMIATVIFSVLLLLLAGAITQVGRIYQRGLTSARTQETARTVMNEIASAIQMSGASVSAIGAADDGDEWSQALCVGSKLYSYRLGQQRMDTKHALVTQETTGSCTLQAPQNLSLDSGVQGNELLGERMRLANLSVERQDTTGLYKINVRVVYGDDDLVCSESITNSCNASGPQLTAAEIHESRDLRCKNVRAGGQFCALADLSTTVERRVNR